MDTQKFQEAPVDIMAQDSLRFLELANQTYKDYLYLLCKKYANIDADRTSVFMYAVDRLGFNLLSRNETQDAWMEFRIPFSVPLTSYREGVDSFEQFMHTLISSKGRN